MRKLALGAVVLGAAGSVVSTFLPWTWTTAFPGNLTVTGYPGGNQLITLVVGILALLQVGALVKVRGLRWLGGGALRWTGLAAAASTWYVLIAIAGELHGLANLEPGGWVAGAAVLLLLGGTFALNSDYAVAPAPVGEVKAGPASPARDTAALVVAFALLTVVLEFGITSSSTEEFLGYVIAIALAARGLSRSGAFARLAALAARNRPVTVLAALVAALTFPLTQNSDQYTAIGANILIFATVALGLNIVVGLAGLLDLGYVAFLGVGAYTAALVSGSMYSRFSATVLPFWATVLLGVAVSAVAGVLIGAPTLRLNGDYLAIVTLGFGEIFRITVNNLDGISGPNLTRGPNGISSIPDLNVVGFDFGHEHTIFGVTLGRFSNYYLLLVAVLAVVVFVFVRVNDSRVGRAWIALREDEVAATAMGISGYRYKLLAFGLGASLAGLAGTVQAHVTTTAVPESYLFAGSAPPNSMFLLAAVVLGGMGTISGPILGAAVLYLVPAKFQFFQHYQLLLFGTTLILMMRFRPEGLVPNRRRQLEFHETEVAAAQAHGEKVAVAS
jgi:branched-chain amino acid transport system permease protein